MHSAQRWAGGVTLLRHRPRKCVAYVHVHMAVLLFFLVGFFFSAMVSVPVEIVRAADQRLLTLFDSGG